MVYENNSWREKQSKVAVEGGIWRELPVQKHFFLKTRKLTPRIPLTLPKMLRKIPVLLITI